MIERIQLIMKSRNISAAQFADEIGVQRSSVSHILTGRNNPSLDIVLKILQRFPEINSDWILTGNGAMLKSDIVTMQQTRGSIKSNENNIKSKNESFGNLFGQSFNNLEEGNPINTNSEKHDIIKPNEREVTASGIEDGVKINSPEEDKHLTSLRTIDQIVIFYSNGTFSYYTQRNQ